MTKLDLRPSKPAKIVKLLSGDWYVLWYSNSERYRQKFGLNYIKDLPLRQRWADRILLFINNMIESGVSVSEKDVPAGLLPPPFVLSPTFHEIDIAKINKKKTFFEYWRIYTQMKIDEGCSDSWTGKFVTLINLMTKFAAAQGVEDFEFEQIDRAWILKFRSFCIQPPYEHGINNLSKNLKIIRQVLKDADIESDDIEVNQKYKSASFKLTEMKTDEIALTLAELQKLNELDLSALPIGYTTVRDSFIVACLTGLRFQDWQLQPENLQYVQDGDKNRAILKVITQKKHKTVLIPLHPMALSLLQKYEFKLPVISNQKSNEYLKEIARLADLNQNVQLQRSKAGKMITEKKLQYEEVKTHTARRTFVTIALFELNIPPPIVMKITGHSSERQLFEYGRISKEKAAMLVARAMEMYMKASI